MAYQEADTGKSGAYRTTILAAVVVLILLYMLAKGLTNRDESKPNEHTTTTNIHGK